LDSAELQEMQHVKIVGLMGMATLTEDESKVREEFSYLQTHFDALKRIYPSFDTLSMGMSGDYKIALECGSNMVRIGSAIFGERNYN
ncbi:MAG TPA: alanine racemase, partial [Salinimicrobium sp.]|nr:alanine racemase [Salinimicrobium sp.]